MEFANQVELMKHIHEISHRIIDLIELGEQKSAEMIKGLSKTEISVIVRLYTNPQIIMRDLSEELHISKSSMTGIVDHLEELGYLRRIINHSDRRSYSLEITEAGKLAQLQHEEYEKEAFLLFIEAMNACNISEEYLDQTEKLLNYLGEHYSL